MSSSYNTNVITRQVEASSFISRVSETTETIPLVSWTSGANGAGTNAPGLGIASPLTNLPAIGADGMAGYNWTESDQFEAARNPQPSQNVGGTGFVDRATVAWPSSGGNEGNGAADDATVTGATNPDNIADPNISGGYIPDPEGSETTTSAMQLLTLAAGWVETP